MLLVLGCIDAEFCNGNLKASFYLQNLHALGFSGWGFQDECTSADLLHFVLAAFLARVRPSTAATNTLPGVPSAGIVSRRASDELFAQSFAAISSEDVMHQKGK